MSTCHTTKKMFIILFIAKQSGRTLVYSYFSFFSSNIFSFFLFSFFFIEHFHSFSVWNATFLLPKRTTEVIEVINSSYSNQHCQLNYSVQAKQFFECQRIKRRDAFILAGPLNSTEKNSGPLLLQTRFVFFFFQIKRFDRIISAGVCY